MARRNNTKRVDEGLRGGAAGGGVPPSVDDRVTPGARRPSPWADGEGDDDSTSLDERVDPDTVGTDPDRADTEAGIEPRDDDDLDMDDRGMGTAVTHAGGDAEDDAEDGEVDAYDADADYAEDDDYVDGGAYADADAYGTYVDVEADDYADDAGADEYDEDTDGDEYDGESATDTDTDDARAAEYDERADGDSGLERDFERDRLASGSGAGPGAIYASEATIVAAATPMRSANGRADMTADTGAESHGPDPDVVEYYYEQPPERRRWPMGAVFAVGLLAGALLLALVWGTTSLVNHQSNDSTEISTLPAGDQPTVLGTEQTRPAQTATPSAPARAAGASARVSTAQACAQVVAAQGKALKAARPAMDAWAVHIGAMNKLVVGAITLAQANAFWGQTRLGAMSNIRDFQVADDRARSLTVACPPATLVDNASVAACSRRAGQQAAALGAARDAVRTWKHHVRDMEMLRMGHMSPATATRMWLANWHKGVDQLQAYHRAAGRVTGTCTP